MSEQDRTYEYHYPTEPTAPETIQVSSTPEPTPPPAPVPNRKPLVIAGIVAACLVAALVGFLVRPNNGSVGVGGGSSTDSTTGFNNPATLAAAVQEAYQASFAQDGYYSPITANCIPTGIAHQFTCLLETSTSYGEPIRASHTVTVTPDGSDWISDSR
jgi:hypothetical protein